MTEQLSLFAEATAAPVDVAVTRDVRIDGARAGAIPKHKTVVHVAGFEPATLARMLALAEDALRYNQCPTARLDIRPTRGTGTNGPVGRGNLMADSRGVHDWRTGQQATWSQLLRALRAQREQEPHVAQARDLAEAYQYLDYYRRAYGTPADAPPQLLASIRDEIRALGGDPARVESPEQTS